MMIIEIFGILVGSVVIGSIAIQQIRGRRRRKELRAAGRVMRVESIGKQESISCVVIVTDFGFGHEAWFLPDGNDDVSYLDSTYKNGILILPLVRHTELEKVCGEKGFELKCVARKW